MTTLHFRDYECVESTNTLALEMARAGEPEGTVISARTQKRGRGRREHGWWDDPGMSVLISMILVPGDHMAEFSQLAFAASLGVAELLETCFGITPQLKWPNDVLAGGRKIAGVLVETTKSDQGWRAVVGIGLNVNQRSFPRQLSTATSVRIETGRVSDVRELARQLAEYVMAHYSRWLDLGFEEMASDWRKYMWGVGKQARVLMNGSDICGEITGIDANGRLLIRDADGRTASVTAADSVQIDE